ncbi:hypothetical protein M422DRAFT_43130 [Sphaerobolus stellatus SS14]|nr:hypothetical protein M422DRAFT_43130 [Sphaerobolus stellatus SS14]
MVALSLFSFALCALALRQGLGSPIMDTFNSAVSVPFSSLTKNDFLAQTTSSVLSSSTAISPLPSLHNTSDQDQESLTESDNFNSTATSTVVVLYIDEIDVFTTTSTSTVVLTPSPVVTTTTSSPANGYTYPNLNFPLNAPHSNVSGWNGGVSVIFVVGVIISSAILLAL